MDRYVLAFVRGDHKFVLIWGIGAGDTIEKVHEQIKAWAEDPEIPFSWYDAVVLGAKAEALMAK